MSTVSKERALDVEKTGSLCDKPVLYGISIKAFLVGVLLLAGVIIQGLWTNPAGLIRGLGTDSSVSAAGLAGVIILLAINTVFGRAVFNHSERAAVYIIIALGGYVGVGGVVLPIVCGMIGLQHQEYGFEYLDVIRDVLTTEDKQHVDVIPDEISLGPYDSPYTEKPEHRVFKYPPLPALER
jgi:hypothetical protein